jgi:hypothetical protein
MTNRFKFSSLIFIFLVELLIHCEFVSIAQMPLVHTTPWVELEDGLKYCELDAPAKSNINNSKLTIVKIDPTKFEFELLTSTEYGKIARPAQCWAEDFKMEIVVNAGMYSYREGQPNKGYLKNFNHFNNPRMSGYYNAMMVLHPKDSTKLPFEIKDLTCTGWDSIQDHYQSFCQGMRMIDCNGNPMAFEKNPTQSCSMVILSNDTEGNIYIIFSRSPYTHQKMIKFLLELPFNLRQTVYLEGGPEASLYINTGKDTISKFGSYVSKSWANDDNDHFWDIPNVIGIRKKR